jgi:hypothetical protein
MRPASECAEERALREMYNAAIKVYREQITALERTSTNAEFENAYERAEAERLIFVHARFIHRYHIQEHGCVAVEGAACAS